MACDRGVSLGGNWGKGGCGTEGEMSRVKLAQVWD